MNIENSITVAKPANKELVESVDMKPNSSSTDTIYCLAQAAFTALKYVCVVAALVVAITVALVTSSLPLAITASIVASIALLVLLSSLFSKVKRIAMAILQYSVATLIDLGAVLLYIATFPYNLADRNPKKFDAPVTATPILCVHGYMHRSSAFMYLRSRLQEEGVGPVYTLNLGFPTCKSLTDYSKIVDKAVKEIQEQTGRKDIFLIGHSMGGVVASEYIAHQANDVEIKGAVTIGSPLHGTKTSCIGVGKCVREMAYNSEFTQKIHETLANIHVPFLHIHSSADLLVQPTRSASYSGAPIQEKFRVRWLGHCALLYSPAVASRILEFYRARESEV